jgi:predicted alpha/beta-fold hydrolase
LPPDFEPLLRNPHLLTIAGNFWPRRIDAARFPATRKEYKIDNKTTVVALQHSPLARARGQIVFLHGLEGSAAAGYIASFAQEALMRGFGVHRLNMRTCGGTEELCETMYHSGLTSDTRFVLEELASCHLHPLFLVGFSLGGNVALKLAGELGRNSLIAGVVAVSTPIDLARSVRQIDRPANILYVRRFLDRLKQRVRRKSASSPELYSPAGLNDVRSIWEFDDRFTAPLFNFGTAANYYATQSAQTFLHQIETPTLVITAKDDPLVPFEIYNHSTFRNNAALTLLAPDHGGHLGFISRRPPRFWLDGVALDWMERLVDSRAAQGTSAEQFSSV